MAKDVQQGYEIWLDVAAPRNRNVLFVPAQMTLRGEARASEVMGDTPAALNAVGGVIPGQRILVDLRMKQVKIIDRMTLPEHAAVDKTLRDLARTEKYQQSAFTHYEKDYDAAPGDDEWPRWLYYIRRLLDAQRLRLAKGTFPSMEKIRAMGDILIPIEGYVPNDKAKPINVLPKLEQAAAAN